MKVHYHMPRARFVVALSLALALGLAGPALLTPSAHAREVVHGFDDIPTGLRLTDEVPGVRFLDPVEVFEVAHGLPVVSIPPPLDPSPVEIRRPRALRHERDCVASGGDSCATGAWRVRFELAEPARTVAVRVGDDAGGCGEFCTTVRMVGFDRAGVVVADSLLNGPRPNSAEPGSTWSPLDTEVSMTARSYAIARVHVFFGRESGVPGPVQGVPDRVQFDGLRYTIYDPSAPPDPPLPPLPSAPRLTIAEPAENGLVPDGSAVRIRGRAILTGAQTELCARVDSSSPPADCEAGPVLAMGGAFSLVVREVPQGRHTITVYLRDALGRMTAVSRRVTVGADVRTDLLDVNQVVQKYDLHDALDAWATPLPGVPYGHRQFVYRGVPLANGKPTIARLHASVEAPWTLRGGQVPPARLHGFRLTLEGLVALPGSPITAPRRPPMLARAPLAQRRARDDAAYEFVLPSAWTSGKVVLVGEVNPPAGPGSIDECARCRFDNAARMTIPFRSQQRLNVTTLKVWYPGATFPVHAGDAFYEFKRIAPIDVRVEPWAASVDASGIARDDNDKVTDLVQGAKDRLGLGGVTIGIHGGYFRGNSETYGAWGGFLGLVEENAAQASWRRPLTSVGHELMHQIGFPHAGTNCFGVENAEAWPPDEMGAIQGWGITWPRPGGGGFRHVFGAADSGRFEPPATAVPRQYFDLMSYCARTDEREPATGDPDLRDAWISVRNWTRLLVEDW